MGSCTLPLVCASTYCWFPPKDLNIVVPSGAGSNVADFLLDIGYEPTAALMNRKWRKTTAKYTALRHLKNQTAITISESMTESIFTVLFSAATTATMNLVTDTQIVCFYPHLTMNRRSAGGYHKPTTRDVISHFLKGWNLTKRTEMYCRPCGVECPSLERRVRGLRGITLVNWKRGIDNEDPDCIQNMAYSWSMGYHCMNMECPFCILRRIELR